MHSLPVNQSRTRLPQYTNTFVYDGWNLLAILTPNSQLLSSFMWGLDLSGSMQGAGGVGGLLGVSYYGSATTNCFAAYDGNGNVAALVNANDGTIIANYEYGPFGEVIRMTGLMAFANPFRFSTKYEDNESDLLYYGYRFYNPSQGRWVSRDPLEEYGGLNIYGFVNNNPQKMIDTDGRIAVIVYPIIFGGGLLIEKIYEHELKKTPRNPGNIPIDIQKETINVKKCQVILFLAHGRKRNPWKFDIDTPSCSGAGFVGCYPGRANGTIPDGAALGQLPMHDDEMGSILPETLEAYENGNIRAKDIYDMPQTTLANIENDPKGYHMEIIVPILERAAVKRARQICANKEHCCDKVEIIVYNYDAPLNAILPSTYRLIIPCKK